MCLNRPGLLFGRSVWVVLAVFGGFGYSSIQMIKGITDHLRAKVLGDKYDAGPMIITWPCRQGGRRVEDMLNRMDGDRGVFADQIKDAFDTQKTFAAHLGKYLCPGDEGIPMDRFIKRDAK